MKQYIISTYCHVQMALHAEISIYIHGWQHLFHQLNILCLIRIAFWYNGKNSLTFCFDNSLAAMPSPTGFYIQPHVRLGKFYKIR